VDVGSSDVKHVARILVGIVAGTAVGVTAMLVLDAIVQAIVLSAHVSGPRAGQVLIAVSSLALLAGFGFGMWLVLHYWRIESGPKPFRLSVPPEDWGKPR
jgi:MFS family permease